MHSNSTNSDDPIIVSSRALLEAFTVQILSLGDQGLGDDEFTDRLRAVALVIETDIAKRVREVWEPAQGAGGTSRWSGSRVCPARAEQKREASLRPSRSICAERRRERSTSRPVGMGGNVADKDPLRAAQVAVAVAAFNMRLFERHDASPELQGFAREHLWAALDALELADPELFVRLATEDAAWLDELRERGELPEAPDQN